MCKNLAKWLPHRICNESVAITLSTTCDLAIECLGVLAIECLGVRAIESLGVRVATIVVRMMKRRLRPVGFPFLSLPLQFCSECFIEWSLPYSLVLRNKRIMSSLLLSKTCENFVVGLIFFVLSSVQLDDPHHCIPT